MKKTRLQQFVKSIDLFIIIIKTLLSTNNNLSEDVKKHCNKGLEILAIINADVIYDTGITEIFKREYDSFYDCFPYEEIKDREFIDIHMICKHIEMCIDNNKIGYTRKMM